MRQGENSADYALLCELFMRILQDWAAVVAPVANPAGNVCGCQKSHGTLALRLFTLSFVRVFVRWILQATTQVINYDVGKGVLRAAISFTPGPPAADIGSYCHGRKAGCLSMR